jgi:hypothetical protein
LPFNSVCSLCVAAAGDRLVMAGLPAAGVQYAVGDDSDDPDATDAGDTAAPDMGQVRFRGRSAFTVIGGCAEGQKKVGMYCL